MQTCQPYMTHASACHVRAHVCGTEGHKVKNAQMKLVAELRRVPVRVRVIISGTPIQVRSVPGSEGGARLCQCSADRQRAQELHTLHAALPLCAPARPRVCV